MHLQLLIRRDIQSFGMLRQHTPGAAERINTSENEKPSAQSHLTTLGKKFAGDSATGSQSSLMAILDDWGQSLFHFAAQQQLAKGSIRPAPIALRMLLWKYSKVQGKQQRPWITLSNRMLFAAKPHEAQYNKTSSKRDMPMYSTEIQHICCQQETC